VAGRGLRIGLLGGSFNPAHDGHRHISVEALKRLELDQVWWLVAPQNPLKPTAGMAPLADRLESARAVARHPRIRAVDIERQLGTRYTLDTLKALKARMPQHRFVWLMGADNLVQFPRWRGWARIFHTVGIAVFDRPSYSHKALADKAARRFARYRVRERRAARVASGCPPIWVFIHARRHEASATDIRERGRWTV